ncbi:MAG: hypothetical protein PHV18_06050 [Lachnospiraceae bacterium]|nr:hypothetical protein [Lachnospiraceae bacterium]
MSIPIAIKLGGYREDFFIYCCNYEYCWRARNYGYKIIKNSDVLLNHQMDEDKNTGTLPKSNIVYYYAVRNNILLAKEFKDAFPSESKQRVKAAFKLRVRHTLKAQGTATNKLIRLKYILCGITDGVRGKSGKKI